MRTLGTAVPNGHEPVVPERLVAHEREDMTKGAKALEKTGGAGIQSSLC